MEKVHQGEAVNIKAATWNSFLDAADFARRARRLVGAQAVPSGFGGNMVYVRNKCGETIPRFGAVVLADAVIPHDAAWKIAAKKEICYTVDLLMGWQDPGKTRPKWAGKLFDAVFCPRGK